jgi:ABC-type nitrate/sulfonate/bicarbonate transport system ATPase subunit
MSGCSPLKTKTMLKVDNLSFAYRSLRFGHVPVLDGLSIEVPEEGFVSILGPSGCGKSTLFSILTGKQKAKSGSFELASPPSYMPQKDLLLPQCLEMQSYPQIFQQRACMRQSSRPSG